MQSPEATVRYAQAGDIVVARWRSNGHTLLDHLREERKRKGTKEGCAEGDCGACVVVVGEASALGESVIYRAVNACIFPLSALDGKMLITVEDLRLPGGELHPVQRAMVDCHGSQCGFCTPGFVMSLYAFYLTHDRPAQETRMHDVLAGNLCRCTGYAPILRAARRMYDYPRVTRDVSRDLRLLKTLKALDGAGDAGSVGTRVLRADDEAAYTPRTLQEASDLYAKHPDAILVGGGTDVGLWITKQKRVPKKVIHLRRVDALCRIAADGDGRSIGAAVPLTEAMQAIATDYAEFEELFARFASLPVRNVATLGGNIGNGSPIGDSMPALIAIGASIRLRRASATRELPLEDFYLGYQKTDLQAGEFIESIYLPPRKPDTYVRAYKVSKRFDDDISAVCCALAIEIAGGSCQSVRIAFGGMAATPKRAGNAERALQGAALDQDSIARAISALSNDFQPMSDHRASAWYRMRVAGNLLRRALAQRVPDHLTRVIGYEGALG